MPVRVGDAQVEGDPALLGGERGGGPVQAQFRLAAIQAHDLDLTPGHRADARPQRLRGRLFRHETAHQARDAPLRLGDLAVGENTAQKALAKALVGLDQPLMLDQVNAD